MLFMNFTYQKNLRQVWWFPISRDGKHHARIQKPRPAGLRGQELHRSLNLSNGNGFKSQNLQHIIYNTIFIYHIYIHIFIYLFTYLFICLFVYLL